MKTKRREFLSLFGSTILAGSVMSSCKSKNGNQSTTDQQNMGQKIDKFGLQLWTVKEDMAKDPKGTLKLISEYGYKQIESFGGEKGIFWGMKPAEFKTYIDSLGLEMVSSHVNPAYSLDPKLNDEFKKLSEDAASVGVKYLINPFPGEFTSSEEWKKLAEGLNVQGKITKEFGIKTGYHNHHFEFIKTKEGDIPEEMLLKGTDASLVDFELDLYWIIKAGQDPLKWFTDYKDRFKLVHVKDYLKPEKTKIIEATEKPEGNFWPLGESTYLGNGRIDFPKVLADARNAGVTYFIVEQERFDGSTPIKDIQKDAEYMKNFVFA